MYDEATYEAFKENHTTKALCELTTDKSGKVSFILENKKWFSGVSSREFMFVVLDAIDAGNYNWWSRGGTITAGKKHSFRIEIDRKNIAENPGLSTDESKLVLEDGVLKGLKDPSLTRLVLPASVKSIAPGAFWESKIESLVLNEGVESIGLQAFAKSQKLTSVTFPSSLKRIGEHAFEDCSALTEINLSKVNLEEIGSSAFRDTGLKDSMLATLTLDGMKVTWIRDNAKARLMPRTLFPDASDVQIDSLSLQNGISASISTFLVEKDGVRMLFDTGMGAPDSRLLEGLKALHIHPEDINYLFITHFHGDHIGGMMKNDSVVFPRAEVYASQLEYDAWMKMPADQKAQVEKTMKAYKDRLHLFVFGDTLPENVMAMNAVGHTPGHTVFQVGKLLVIGDLFHGAALQLAHPEICAQYDMDKKGAVKSRKYYLQYARENGLTMAGMHLPVPAFMK